MADKGDHQNNQSQRPPCSNISKCRRYGLLDKVYNLLRRMTSTLFFFICNEVVPEIDKRDVW